jgi:hypothetical protein
MFRLLVLVLIMLPLFSWAQVGIGVYPSGNEPGFGVKTSQTARYFADIRIADVLLPQDRTEFRIRTEILAKRRFTFYERANFITGIGPRLEHNGSDGIFYGLTLPVAVEAFPFPFPNVGLFFEVGSYFVSDFNGRSQAGFRTVGGINFYFMRNGSENTNQ